MPRKIKIQRKEAEEPDEFISLTSRIATSVRRNYRMVLSAVGVVLAILLIIVIWYYYQAGKERSARDVLNQAVVIYHAAGQAQADAPSDETFRQVLTQLTALEENHPHTESAVTALFYMGESAYQLREYDRAIDYYTRFLRRARKDHYLRPLAYEGLGYCYEDKQDYAKAVDAYKQSLAEPSVAVAELLYIAIGRCYEALNDRANALDYYTKAASERKDSIFLTIAGDKVAALRP